MENSRILAQDIYVSNDSYTTHLNNNDVIIGPSGSGKTTGYVLPNIENAEESLIVIDTKGNLYNKTLAPLTLHGYESYKLDFKTFTDTLGYKISIICYIKT